MTIAAFWTRRVADEFWSGPVTPLTFSLLAELMVERMVREPLRAAGLASLSTAPVLRLHASHVYANADLMTRVMSLLPVALRSEGLLALLPADLRRSLEAGTLAAGGAVGTGAAGLRTAAIVLRLLLRESEWLPWQRAAAFERECARVRLALAGTAGSFSTPLSTVAIHGEMARVRQRLGDYLAVVSWGMVYAYVFFHLATELARRWAPALIEERAALTVGLGGAASLDLYRDLVALGALLARDPALVAAIRSTGAETAWASIADDIGPLGDAFRSFLARHGHRLTGRDLLCPTWREAPAIVVGLAALAGGGDTGEERSASAATVRDAGAGAARRLGATAAVERAIGGGVGGFFRRAAFRAALAGARRYYVVRDNMRYHADYFLARLRQLTIALGERLVAEDRLASPLDLCFFTFDEIGHALEGRERLVALAAERRAAYERDTRLVPTATFTGAETAEQPSPAPNPGTGGVMTLAGGSGAPGYCCARARLVHGPQDFDAVERGDVVVASYVDPGWTPVLELAAGLVLEAGGLLSHGAIVARELGIPALVGVHDATRIIASGDIVDLDSEAGTLTIIARA